jgi:hypothetical protein
MEEQRLPKKKGLIRKTWEKKEEREATYKMN